MRQWLRHRERGMLIARRAASRAARSGAGIVRATPPRTRGHTTLDEQHSQHGSREQKDRALARPPPDESAEPTREVEQLGQRKPLPRRPARHARRRANARRRLEARRRSRGPSGLRARARAASGQQRRNRRGASRHSSVCGTMRGRRPPRARSAGKHRPRAQSPDATVVAHTLRMDIVRDLMRAGRKGVWRKGS